MLQLREKEIFETLKKIKKHDFVVIGGYAINAYTLPRFSVDCDIVVKNSKESEKIGKEIERFGYKKVSFKRLDHAYFTRYEKKIIKDFRVSLDIMAGKVMISNTNASFDADWIFENSEFKSLKGKTITEELKLKIANVDTLIVMKFISSRINDIRDIFMLMPQAKNIGLIKQEIEKRCEFDREFSKIENKISLNQFKDNLQGVYGYVNDKIFEKHKDAVLKLKFL